MYVLNTVIVINLTVKKNANFLGCVHGLAFARHLDTTFILFLAAECHDNVSQLFDAPFNWLKKRQPNIEMKDFDNLENVAQSNRELTSIPCQILCSRRKHN